MIVVCLMHRLRTNLANWLFAAMLLTLAPIVQAHPAQSQSPPQTIRPVPKPAPADPKLLAAVFTKASPSSIADLKAMEQRVEALVALVSPAVVAVEVGSGSGSGVVISPDGLVLTAGHVCGRPDREVRFTFPGGRTAYGKTLGVDPESDTGLMKITDRGIWPCAPMGELEHARIGDWVLAFGHPGGFDPRRSLVVRLGRIIRLAPEAIQTDCTISPGDSGGPLFDMYGRVVGIHSAISRSLAENFHVPVSEFYETWDELANAKTDGDMADEPRAYLGATVEDTSKGCRVSEVEVSGPASQAGLRVGDLVLKVDDREIKVAATFRRWLVEATPGETLKLEIKRGDKISSLELTLRAPPIRRR